MQSLPEHYKKVNSPETISTIIVSGPYLELYGPFDPNCKCLILSFKPLRERQMPDKPDLEIGNFIDALLDGLATLAEIERIWTDCEANRLPPAKKHQYLYAACQTSLLEFQEKTGFAPGHLLAKWQNVDKAERKAKRQPPNARGVFDGPQA